MRRAMAPIFSEAVVFWKWVRGAAARHLDAESGVVIVRRQLERPPPELSTNHIPDLRREASAAKCRLPGPFPSDWR